MYELCSTETDVAHFRIPDPRSAGRQFELSALYGRTELYVRRVDDCPLTDEEQSAFDAGRREVL